MEPDCTVIDDLSAPHPHAANGARWELISDRVMGGVSRGVMEREMVASRMALRMRGAVSLENNGGFVQMALDMSPDGGTVDARAWRGIELDVLGNGEAYNLHLRTADVTRPWQSYRQGFTATREWRRLRLSFADFKPHRLDAALDLSRLRRLGLLAIGRAFDADLALAGIRFFR
ncbi:MAG: CIA30 family protein [Rhodobacteraceae bacterium]|nr:MAG: CIA30 family protein [Paracoccaceae bacterium]